MSGNGRLYRFFFGGFVLFLVAYSLFLFGANVDQLWVSPETAATRALTSVWDDDLSISNEFAGGFWKDAYFWRSLGLTLAVSVVTTVLVTLAGVPAAYALSRFKVPARGAVDVLFSAIIVVPASSVGLCLIVMFNHGPLFEFQQWMGFRFAHSIFPGMVMASAVLSFAFGVSAWKATFDSINPRFGIVARTLGSGVWESFKNVEFPMARNGILAGIILAWARTIAEFGAVLLFCGTFGELPRGRFSPLMQWLNLDRADWLPVAVWSQIEYGNVEYGFALAYVLVIIGGVCVYALHRMGGKGYIW